MSIPAAPTQPYLTQANGMCYLTWALVSGATTYSIERSTDGINFTIVGTPSVNNYLDNTVSVGTNYYYQVASTNISGTSSYIATLPTNIVPTLTGDLSLGELRYRAQQKADRVNSNFVTLPEWNFNINQSYFELYDLLVTAYEDYYMKTPYQLTTTGSQQVTLPTDFYKLLGVDLGLVNNTTAWITLKQFQFIERNRYVYPQINSTFFGCFNLQYRLMGNTLFFIPTPSAGQFLQIWYIPKLTELLADTDIASGISGWTEYVILDAAMKALQKEESDVSVLAMQKMAVMKRIEEASQARDAGQPSRISATRFDDIGAGYGFPNGDGAYAGW